MVRVLIIDDDIEICETFTDILVSAGYEVHTLQSSVDAFRLLPQLVPDVVLLDMQMPGVPGVMLLSYIRRLGRLSLTKVIIVSGYPETAMAAKQVWGADLFLVKPVSPKLLLDTLTKYQ